MTDILPAQQQPSLTTEYTPRERGSATKLPATPQPIPAPSGGQTSVQAVSTSNQAPKQSAPSDGVDTSILPVATAPPSHPHLDLDAPGVIDGRSILEIDLNALAEKNWRRPGADISDWFNYGFDEISWEAYCYRRREVNEVANLLKANVLVRTYFLALANVATPRTILLIETTIKFISPAFTSANHNLRRISPVCLKSKLLPCQPNFVL